MFPIFTPRCMQLSAVGKTLITRTSSFPWVNPRKLSSSAIVRTMSDHMDKTAESPREPGICEAEVAAISQASETVKVLTLKVDDPTFTFKAGQWVDFFIEGIDIFTGYSMYSGPTQLKEAHTIDLAVKLSDYAPTIWVHNQVGTTKPFAINLVDIFMPGVSTVGGFSMSSAPRPLREKGHVGLAVKYSAHPPAHWVHKQCVVGSKVKVRAGGDKLVFDPQPGDPSWNVLLISGGIGINPLMSLMHHAADLHDQRKGNPEGYTPGKMELLFSASSKSELIFKETIDDLTSKHSPNIAARFFVTKESAEDSAISNRRIDASDIKSAIERLGGEGPLRCFVCGPPTMISDMEGLLSNAGIPPSDVFCEKWW